MRGDGSASLTWSAPNTNGDAFILYTIYRDGVFLATTTQRSFEDGALENGRAYSYRVSANNSMERAALAWRSR